MERLDRKLPAAFLLLLPLLSVSGVANQKTTVSWCVLSDAEEQKCLDLAGNATALNIRGTLQCVRGLNTRDCIDKIKNGTADAASMFADDIYAAGLCHGLELAAGESHNGVDGISYYVVAMARRSSSDLSLLEMHERSSCHPGMRTTVGWTVPIGYLVNTSQIRVGEQCNFPRAVGNFFGYSCVPGVKDPQHDPRGNNPKNLCEACIGDDNDRHICANSHRERHYGEAGALRCVAENLGDVAFVKHTTIFDNLDGKNQGVLGPGPGAGGPEAAVPRWDGGGSGRVRTLPPGSRPGKRCGGAHGGQVPRLEVPGTFAERVWQRPPGLQPVQLSRLRWLRSAL
uniref:Serotransferrin n=1 Tax=Scophthalmus maximus TaxID=52904 RepID=A0A8D3DDT7_SCOMX